MSATLRELADAFGCELHGDPKRVVERVGTLSGAGPDAVTFLANPLYRSQLAATRAGAVILEDKHRAGCPTACLVHAQPYVTYARVAAFLHPSQPPSSGIHPSAVVASSARVAASAEIAAHAVIGAGSRIGDSAVIGPGCALGKDVEIGEGTRLVANVAVLDRVRIGARGLLHPGTVIGADGFGFAPDGGRWLKIPQLGSVVIGDDVEIGANTCVDRGTIEDTVIEDGVKIDNLVQIGHNVRIGAHSILAGMVGVAGSTKIGKRCMIAGGVGILNSIEICDDVVITLRSVIAKSIDKPGTYSGTLHAEESSQWRRNAARFRQLDALADRLIAMEKILARLSSEERKKQDD